jgi:spore coat polysaccharide biosynthesis predicted glycosyltransferase SpsG
MKILYRVDEDNITGTGHLMELVTIQKAVASKVPGAIAHACTNGSELAAQWLAEAGVTEIITADTRDESSELQCLTERLRHSDYDFIICDLLNRSPDYYAYIYQLFNKSVVILDDGLMRETAASLCINFSILQDPDFYLNARDYPTQYWIGPEYFPFGESLFGLRSRLHEAQDQVKTIFVNQGGTDPYGLTAKTLHALERIDINARIVVVVGGGLTEEHYNELDAMRPNLKRRYEFHKNIPMREMHALMAESDLALTAAGNTLYEFAFLGVPCVVISHHANHDRVARAFEARGSVVNLGIGSEISIEYMLGGVRGVLEDIQLRKGAYGKEPSDKFRQRH